MSSSIKWFVANGKSPVGPLSFVDLHEKIVDGSLTLETKVWHTDLGAWTRAKLVPEVAEAIASILQEQMAKPRWMVVIDKRVNKEPEGPYSDNEVEACLVQGTFVEKTLYWTKGQAGWLTLDLVKGLVSVKQRAEEAKAQRPPLIEEAIEAPDIPDDDSPPMIEEEEASAAEHLPQPKEAIKSQAVVETLVSAVVKSATKDLEKGLEAVFENSRWLPTVQVFLSELSKGVHSGDAIKIDGVVEKIRLFLLREVQPDRSSRHPSMTEKNLKEVSGLLLALVNDPEVRAKVQNFDPFYSVNRSGVPSITAMRTRAMLGTVNG